MSKNMVARGSHSFCGTARNNNNATESFSFTGKLKTRFLLSWTDITRLHRQLYDLVHLWWEAVSQAVKMCIMSL